MVFKIIGELEDDKFNQILDNLSKKSYNLLYVEDTLYVSERYLEDSDSILPSLREVFVPSDNFLITTVTKDNIKKLPLVAQEWCSNNYVRLDRLRLERDQQSYLAKVNKAIDNAIADLETEISKEAQREPAKYC